MKITKTQLKKIIKEELEKQLGEGFGPQTRPPAVDELIKVWHDHKISAGSVVSFGSSKYSPDQIAKAKEDQKVIAPTYGVLLHTLPNYYNHYKDLEDTLNQIRASASPLKDEAIEAIQTAIAVYKGGKKES